MTIIHIYYMKIYKEKLDFTTIYYLLLATTLLQSLGHHHRLAFVFGSE